MTQITTASEVTADGDDNGSIRRQRQDFVYDANSNLSQPVIIRGTNKVFRSAPGLGVQEQPSAAALDDLIARTADVDRNLQLLRVSSVTQVQLDIVTPDIITFRLPAAPDKVFYFTTPLSANETLAFKRFAGLIGVPYAFAKKNPTVLNRTNFEFHLRRTKAEQETPVPVDFIYDGRPQEIRYNFTPADAETEADVEVRTLQAYQVMNILKAPNSRGRKPADTPIDSPSITTRLPMFSDILAGLKRQVSAIDPTIELALQSVAIGYDTSNKGRHFARMLFDSEKLRFDLLGETYDLAVTLDTDYSGEAKDFGQVNVTFALFRQICSNGMVASWTDAEKAGLRDTFVNETMSALALAEDSEEYALAKRGAEAQFHAVFDEGGVKMPFALANAGLDQPTFALALKYFLTNTDGLGERFKSLEAALPIVDDEEFVKTVRKLEKNHQLASAELVKYFIIEYLAGTMTGQQQFKTAWDVVQFFTLLARSYPTNVIVDIEKKAMPFALDLVAGLGAVEQPEAPLLPAYTAQIQQRLLVNA